ncbi:unnamed protein product [Brassica oleracea]
MKLAIFWSSFHFLPTTKLQRPCLLAISWSLLIVSLRVFITILPFCFLLQVTLLLSRERLRTPEESELKQIGDAGGSSKEADNKRQGRASQNNGNDKSPLHKNSYDGIGRSKPKPNLRAVESPEKVTVVPKFGDWDENNPASADGYTHIFNKVREERSSNVSGGSSRTPPHFRNNPSKTSRVRHSPSSSLLLILKYFK